MLLLIVDELVVVTSVKIATECRAKVLSLFHCSLIIIYDHAASDWQWTMQMSVCLTTVTKVTL